MSKRPRNGGKPLAERLAELSPSGRSGRDLHTHLRREGYRVSLASVARGLQRIRGPQRVCSRVPAPAQPPITSTPVAAPVVGTEPDPELSRLIDAVHAAADDLEFARRLRDLLAYQEPAIREALAAGLPLVHALADSRFADVLGCLRQPRDFADLALLVCETPAPFGWVREEGESEDAFEAAMAAKRAEGRQRAIELLRDTLSIVEQGAKL
jgi:hypothetical protein